MNNKFCILPFIHFNGYMDGTAKPCCDSQKAFIDIDLKKTTIDKSFNSDEYKKLRVDMIKGIHNEYCSACYDLESQNITSSRQKWNEHHSTHLKRIQDNLDFEKFDGEVKPDFTSLDLRPSNICNFKCRTCNDGFSTKWQEEKADFYKINENILYFGKEKLSGVNKVNFKLNEDSMKNIEVLYFAGGEPFVLEEHFALLESLKNKKDISLMYNTNFSILKYKGKTIFEHLKDFRNVHFSISIDGLGEVGEFVRTGFDTKVFKKNLLIMKWAIDHYKNITYDFQYTCSLLNSLNFFEFLEELGEEQELINFHYVQYPFWYNTINFDTIKSDTIKLFESNLKNITSEKLKQSMLKYLEYLKNSNVKQWDKINAQKYLKANIAHSLIFNDTVIPEKLSFINDVIVEKKKQVI
jgi:MoaA/NifB/PqqE/SkfB family radical SAM enzyme